MHWFENAFDDVHCLNIRFMSFNSHYMLYIILWLQWYLAGMI